MALKVEYCVLLSLFFILVLFVSNEIIIVADADNEVYIVIDHNLNVNKLMIFSIIGLVDYPRIFLIEFLLKYATVYSR